MIREHDAIVLTDLARGWERKDVQGVGLGTRKTRTTRNRSLNSQHQTVAGVSRRLKS